LIGSTIVRYVLYEFHVSGSWTFKGYLYYFQGCRLPKLPSTPEPNDNLRYRFEAYQGFRESVRCLLIQDKVICKYHTAGRMRCLCWNECEYFRCYPDRDLQHNSSFCLTDTYLLRVDPVEGRAGRVFAIQYKYLDTYADVTHKL